MLERFRMTECNPNNTPSSPKTKHTETTIEGDETAKNLPYRELVGSLMYLALATRPDIAHTVSSLSQFNENPSHIHWVAAKRVLECVQKFTSLGKVTKPGKMSRDHPVSQIKR